MDSLSKFYGSFSVLELNSLIPVPEVYSINILVFTWPVISANCGGVTAVDVLHCTEVDTPTPDTGVGLVPDVPQVFESDPVILLI